MSYTVWHFKILKAKGTDARNRKKPDWKVWASKPRRDIALYWDPLIYRFGSLVLFLNEVFQTKLAAGRFAHEISPMGCVSQLAHIASASCVTRSSATKLSSR